MTRRPVILTVLALLAACGGDGMTTPADPATVTLRLEFGNIYVVDDCDGIEGDGEFEFTVDTRASTNGTPEVLLHQSATLGPGGRSSYIESHTYTLPADQGGQRTVRFTATEWDKNVFGTTYPDSRMDHASASVTYQYRNGAWNTLGDHTAELGVDGCRVQLWWSASAT